MVTSPTGKTAHLVFGFGCGFLTVFIRTFTFYPEGVTFAFLLMNGLAYLMDRVGADPIFGQIQTRRHRRINTAAVSAALIILVLSAVLATAGRRLADTGVADAALTRSVRRHFQSADRIVKALSHDPAVDRYRVYHGRQMLGWLSVVPAEGYGGPMEIHLALDPEETVVDIRIDSHRESPTLGSRITAPAYLRLFAGLSPAKKGAVHETVKPLTGATVSARALINAVERALAAGDPAAARATSSLPPLPAVPDGVHQGQGRGYHGPITLRLTVEGGRIADIVVIGHRETAGIGARALETLIDEVMAAQSLGVDGVSGATGTSRGFIEAARNAFEGN